MVPSDSLLLPSSSSPSSLLPSHSLLYDKGAFYLMEHFFTNLIWNPKNSPHSSHLLPSSLTEVPFKMFHIFNLTLFHKTDKKNLKFTHSLLPPISFPRRESLLWQKYHLTYLTCFTQLISQTWFEFPKITPLLSSLLSDVGNRWRQ